LGPDPHHQPAIYIHPCIGPSFRQNIKLKYFRHEDSGESIRELDAMKDMGEQYYAESGDLCKLVGVLRATDIFWNPDKR
jgi:hypothetical protein